MRTVALREKGRAERDYSTVGGKSSISHITRLRKRRYEKASSRRVEGPNSPQRSSAFSEQCAPCEEQGDGNDGITRYLLADDRHRSPPPRDCAFICYTKEAWPYACVCARARAYMCACICHSSSRTIPHPRDYSRWQRLIIPRKVHPPIMVSRRAATSSLLRILRCYVIITDNPRRFLTDTLHAHLFPGLDRGGIAGDGEEERRFSMMKSNARRFAEHRAPRARIQRIGRCVLIAFARRF